MLVYLSVLDFAEITWKCLCCVVPYVRAMFELLESYRGCNKMRNENFSENITSCIFSVFIYQIVQLHRPEKLGQTRNVLSISLSDLYWKIIKYY